MPGAISFGEGGTSWEPAEIPAAKKKENFRPSGAPLSPIFELINLWKPGFLDFIPLINCSVFVYLFVKLKILLVKIIMKILPTKIPRHKHKLIQLPLLNSDPINL